MMTEGKRNGLRFPCECVSSAPGGYTDPWADVTKRKLLPNGTKEQILNIVAREPKTISEMAQELAALFERRQPQMEQAFLKTDLPQQGWQLSDVTQCLYANMYRSAR